MPGSLRQGDGTLTVIGSGDISQLVGDGAVLSLQRALDGTFLGLIAAVIVVTFIPYLLALVPPIGSGPGHSQGGLSLVAREWLLRITPAAGFPASLRIMCLLT